MAANPEVHGKAGGREPREGATREAQPDAPGTVAAPAAYEQALAALPAPVGAALAAATAAWAEYQAADQYSADEPARPGREVEFRAELAGKLRKYGSLSEAQVAAVQRGLEREAQRATEREQVLAQGPLAAGRQVLEGTVLSDKWTEDTGYGSQHKMLLQLGSGHRVWGTVPRALEDACQLQHTVDEATGALTPVPPASPQLRGTTVRLTATVQPKADDPTFGYYSRPAKAEVLAPAPAAEVAA